MLAFFYLIFIFLVVISPDTFLKCTSRLNPRSLKTKHARALQGTSLSQPNDPSAQVFTADPSAGREIGVTTYKDSAHFRFYARDLSKADKVLQMMEGVYSCFVVELGWRSTGLSNNLPYNAAGPFKKTNVYSDPALESSAEDGYMGVDGPTAMSWLAICPSDILSGATTHEYGHALHYHQQTWVDQERTGMLFSFYMFHIWCNIDLISHFILYIYFRAVVGVRSALSISLQK